jgi:carbamoyltransferase
MMLTFDTRPEATPDMIAALHPADLTCRAQIVPDDAGSGIARILTAYRQLTGHGVLLNTSLNLHGDPIARTADDALAVFASSELRHLQLGPYLVHKRP